MRQMYSRKGAGFSRELRSRGNAVSERRHNRCDADEQERAVEGRRAQQDRPLQVHKRRDTERQGAEARGAGAGQVGSEIQAEAGLRSRALAENESSGREKERERASERYLSPRRRSNKLIRICMASNAK